MKLGSQTGSLTNHIYSISVKGQPEPVVGMGATILGWTDRYPATIIETWIDKKGVRYVTVQEDDYKRTDNRGMCESQEYEYTPNPNRAKNTFRSKDGRWEGTWFNPKTKRWSANKGNGLCIGERDKYHDFSF